MLVNTEVGCGPLEGCALGAGAGLEFEVAELVLPGEALEVAVFEPELLSEAEVLPENGLADPEPQPTTEATAMAAALKFIKTLGLTCTLNLATGEFQLTESTVRRHQLWLYRGTGLAVLGKNLRCL
jgi:hypothetical protein